MFRYMTCGTIDLVEFKQTHMDYDDDNKSSDEDDNELQKNRVR